MNDDQGLVPDDAADQGAGFGVLAVVLILFCLVLVALAGIAALDPGVMVALFPDWLIGPTSAGRTLQVAGASAILAPVLAAVVVDRRGSRRLAAWLVVLALLALLPGGMAIEGGSDKVRRASTVDAPAPQHCVEYSGGDTTCPGG